MIEWVHLQQHLLNIFACTRLHLADHLTELRLAQDPITVSIILHEE